MLFDKMNKSDVVPKPLDLYNRIIYSFATVPDGQSVYRHLEIEIADFIRNKMAIASLEFPNDGEKAIQRLVELLRLPTVVQFKDVTERGGTDG